MRSLKRAGGKSRKSPTIGGAQTLSLGPEVYQRAVEAAPNALVMVDVEGKILLINQQAENLFGYKREELIGQEIEMLIPERFRPKHAGYVKNFFQEPKARSMGAGRDLFGLKKDGTEVPIEIGLNPIETPEGLFTLASIIDITERKRVEAEIAAKSKELEALLHVTSHDLSEPLRAIENFSRMLLDEHSGRLDEGGQDLLRRVVKGGARMHLLLNDILTLSRVRKMTPPAGEVKGERIVREALDGLQPTIQETKAKIQVSKDLPRLRADRTWATQAVYNLVSNALKFTRPGEHPEVEIAAYRPGPGEADGGEGFVVRDRGPGVAPEHAERIFELFQRAVGHEVEGTGAGLAIVRAVAERHSGKTWVRPREGGGSEFIITFGKKKMEG